MNPLLALVLGVLTGAVAAVVAGAPVIGVVSGVLSFAAFCLVIYAVAEAAP